MRSSFVHLAALALLIGCGQKSDLQSGDAKIGTAGRTETFESQSNELNPSSISADYTYEANTAVPEDNQNQQTPVVAQNTAIESPVSQNQASLNERPVTPTPSENSHGAPAENLNDQAEEQAPEALPPSIVSGAYMSCRPTAEYATVVCEIRNANKTTRSIALDEVLAWSILPDGQSIETPTAAEQVNSTDGALFFVNVKTMKAGKIVLKIVRETMETLSFDVQSDRMASGIIQQARPITSTSAYGRTLFTQGATRVLGDSPADAGCANGASPQKTRSWTVSFTGIGSSLVSFILPGVCGLTGSKAKVTINQPSPLKPIVVRLTPTTANQLIQANLPVVPGNYTIVVDARENLVNGKMDTFVISLLQAYSKNGNPGYTVSND